MYLGDGSKTNVTDISHGSGQIDGSAQGECLVLKKGRGLRTEF